MIVDFYLEIEKRKRKMIDFVKQRIHAIIELKKQRHFLPGVLLGGYAIVILASVCLLYTSPSPRDRSVSRMPSSA